MSNDNNNNKHLEIENEVVAIIAGLAATEVKGVAGMSGGIAGGFAEMLGRKNLTKGVEIETENNKVNLDIFIIVDYGVSIPKVTDNIRNNVKDAIKQMTGLETEELVIHVQGVEFSNNEESEEENIEQEND